MYDLDKNGRVTPDEYAYIIYQALVKSGIKINWRESNLIKTQVYKNNSKI